MKSAFVFAGFVGGGRGSFGSVLVACAVASASVAGCAMVDDEMLDDEHIGDIEQESTVGNGILLNGILLNGILLNGVSSVWGDGQFSEGVFAEELDFYGIKTPGLHKGEFNGHTLVNSWYWRFLLQDTTPVTIQTGADSTETMSRGDLAAEVLKYTFECAMSSVQSINVDLHPFWGGGTPKHIEFRGNLGLAENWNTGSCNQNCQRWVSACLAARTNALGETVQVSLAGFHPKLQYRDEPEAQEFSYQEASFAGNLFNGEGVYACSGTGSPSKPGKPGLARPTASDLQTRVCGHGNSNCAGFDFTGFCGGRSLITNKLPQCAYYDEYWLSCENPQKPGTYEYNSITVYLKTDDVLPPFTDPGGPIGPGGPGNIGGGFGGGNIGNWIP